MVNFYLLFGGGERESEALVISSETVEMYIRLLSAPLSGPVPSSRYYRYKHTLFCLPYYLCPWMETKWNIFFVSFFSVHLSPPPA